MVSNCPEMGVCALTVGICDLCHEPKWGDALVPLQTLASGSVPAPRVHV